MCSPGFLSSVHASLPLSPSPFPFPHLPVAPHSQPSDWWVWEQALSMPVIPPPFSSTLPAEGALRPRQRGRTGAACSARAWAALPAG